MAEHVRRTSGRREARTSGAVNRIKRPTAHGPQQKSDNASGVSGADSSNGANDARGGAAETAAEHGLEVTGTASN